MIGRFELLRTKLEYELPESLAMEYWACSNYTKGRVQKPLKGSITLEAWEGVLGKCKIDQELFL